MAGGGAGWPGTRTVVVNGGRAEEAWRSSSMVSFSSQLFFKRLISEGLLFDGEELLQDRASLERRHAEAAEEALAMAAATAATSAAGTAENKDKGKRIWIPDEGRPSNPTDDLMLDIDGDDLIFSDAAFSCLHDFPCLGVAAWGGELGGGREGRGI